MSQRVGRTNIYVPNRAVDESRSRRSLLRGVSVWAGEDNSSARPFARRLAILQRYIAAYARHGLQALARCSKSRGVLEAVACRSPRSAEGNASGSPSARMATYCAVHFPMPGISQSRFRKASESTIPSKLIRPSQTARARVRMVSARVPITPRRARFASARTSGAGNR